MRPRGFTLIELLVVISIIALLASVVLASLNTARDRGRLGAGKYFSAQVEHVAGDYLAGAWDFDDCTGSTTVDRSGNGNTGIFTGSPTWQSDTPYGTGCSLLFSGSGQYITIPASAALDMGGSSFTVSVWMKKTTVGTGIIFEHSIWGANETYQIEHISSGSGIRFNFPAMHVGVGPLDVSGNISDGKWHSVVGILDSQAQLASIYLDGMLAGSKAVAVTPASATAASYIGARGSNTLAFPGYIDMVRVYKKALTASEVSALYTFESQKIKFAEK